MRRSKAPRLTEHEARDASERTRWWWHTNWKGTLELHAAACICLPCQACRKAFVAGCLYKLPKKKKK